MTTFAQSATASRPAHQIPVEQIAVELMKTRSLSGQELGALRYVEQLCESFGLSFERIPVAPERWNLLIRFSDDAPTVLLTTHLDVVPAPESLFTPVLTESTLIGRGACDALGIAAAMFSAALQLRQEGVQGFGVLFVVGEELDGCGALASADALANRGIQYLINGEPTEGRLISAHKGGLEVDITCTGRAAHSGYPERGEDANAKLLAALQVLRGMDLGTHPQLGAATLNIGMIDAGVAGNVISPRARARCLIRTVAPSQSATSELRSRINEQLSPFGEVQFPYATEAVELLTVPGFPTGVVSYCTDIPNFAAMRETKKLLLGPGTIFNAHTDTEHILLSELRQGVSDYCRLVRQLLSE